MHIRRWFIGGVSFLFLVSARTASADTGREAERNSATSDRGVRLHATAGYPAFFALGVGFKAGDAELMLQGGGAAAFAALAATAELSATHDFADWSWGLAYGGLAGSLVHGHVFVIDCYEGETCQDFVQTLYWVGPRIGVRGKVDPRNPRHGHFLDLNAGPLIGTCSGDCRREIPVSIAVQLRYVFDF